MTPTQAGTTLALLLTLGAGATLLGSGAQADSPKTPPTKTKKGTTKTPAAKKSALRWNQDLVAARKRAAELGQPLLVFQLLGDLDQEFC